MNHIPKIIIKPVMAENQRYFTVGDYTYDAEDDTLTIFISRMDDWRSEMAVALHEVFEAVACIAADVEMKDVDLFDLNFEANRFPDDLSEPGDNENAPYHKQHTQATAVEKEACLQLGLPWNAHENNVQEA